MKNLRKGYPEESTRNENQNQRENYTAGHHPQNKKNNQVQKEPQLVVARPLFTDLFSLGPTNTRSLINDCGLRVSIIADNVVHATPVDFDVLTRSLKELLATNTNDLRMVVQYNKRERTIKIYLFIIYDLENTSAELKAEIARNNNLIQRLEEEALQLVEQNVLQILEMTFILIWLLRIALDISTRSRSPLQTYLRAAVDTYSDLYWQHAKDTVHPSLLKPGYKNNIRPGEFDSRNPLNLKLVSYLSNTDDMASPPRIEDFEYENDSIKNEHSQYDESAHDRFVREASDDDEMEILSARQYKHFKNNDGSQSESDHSSNWKRSAKNSKNGRTGRKATNKIHNQYKQGLDLHESDDYLQSPDNNQMQPFFAGQYDFNLPKYSDAYEASTGFVPQINNEWNDDSPESDHDGDNRTKRSRVSRRGTSVDPRKGRNRLTNKPTNPSIKKSDHLSDYDNQISTGKTLNSQNIVQSHSKGSVPGRSSETQVNYSHKESISRTEERDRHHNPKTVRFDTSATKERAMPEYNAAQGRQPVDNIFDKPLPPYFSNPEVLRGQEETYENESAQQQSYSHPPENNMPSHPNDSNALWDNEIIEEGERSIRGKAVTQTTVSSTLLNMKEIYNTIEALIAADAPVTNQNRTRTNRLTTVGFFTGNEDSFGAWSTALMDLGQELRNLSQQENNKTWQAFCALKNLNPDHLEFSISFGFLFDGLVGGSKNYDIVRLAGWINESQNVTVLQTPSILFKSMESEFVQNKRFLVTCQTPVLKQNGLYVIGVPLVSEFNVAPA